MNEGHELLTISEVARRSGVASSALRFYEQRGLIASQRTGSGHRRFPRAVLRRIAFIVFAQKIGLSLDEIAAELRKLPRNHVPERSDWAKLSESWTRRVDERIAELQRLRAGLTQCIGCGCLSLQQCRLANPGDRQTLWTAPMQEGSVPVTVTVDDGKSGTATDTVTIQVIKPPVKEYTFEDVHFDFDRYSLRPEAVRILDEAIRAMRDDASLRLEIEGHTCSIGTAEYNLALGERRANSVKDYLTSRGVSADRLRTVSYGEERPKHDNAREETRRLNRRAQLVVRLSQ